MSFFQPAKTIFKYESLTFLRSSFFVYALLFNFLALGFCFFSRWLTIDFSIHIVYDFLNFYVYGFGSLLAVFLGSKILADHLQSGSAEPLLSFGIQRHAFYFGLLFSIFFNISFFTFITYASSVLLSFVFETDISITQSAIFFICHTAGFFVLAAIAFALSVFCRFEVAFFGTIGLFFIGINVKSLMSIGSKNLLMEPMFAFLSKVFDLSLFQISYADISTQEFDLILSIFCYAGTLISLFGLVGVFIFERKNI